MASPLLSEVPIHWWIELGLVTFIIYILFCKREYNPLKWCGRAGDEGADVNA